MDQEKIVRRDTVGQRLSLEIGTRVMLTFNGTNASVRGRFVGMDPGAYLVVSLPSVTDLNGVLTEKRPAALKFVAGGMVYGFQAFIIEHFQKQNLHLLILSYPDKVSAFDLRGEKRTDCYTQATLTLEEEGFTGNVQDISPSGCRFIFAHSTDEDRPGIRLGQKVTISVKLPELDGTQVFPCIVKNVRHDGQSLSLGLQFDLRAETKFSMDFFHRFLGEKNPH